MKGPGIGKISNPLKKKSMSGMKAQHARTLKSAGVKPPKSPI